MSPPSKEEAERLFQKGEQLTEQMKSCQVKVEKCMETLLDLQTKFENTTAGVSHPLLDKFKIKITKLYQSMHNLHPVTREDLKNIKARLRDLVKSARNASRVLFQTLEEHGEEELRTMVFTENTLPVDIATENTQNNPNAMNVSGLFVNDTNAQVLASNNKANNPNQDLAGHTTKNS